MEEQRVWLIALIFVLFVLLPIGYIWVGIKLLFKNFRFRKNALLVTGKVVETNEAVSGPWYSASTKFRPVFEFNSPAGEMLRGESTSASIKYDFPHNSEHEILVNFHKPEIIQMPGDRIYLRATALIAISSAILFGGGSFMLSLG